MFFGGWEVYNFLMSLFKKFFLLSVFLICVLFLALPQTTLASAPTILYNFTGITYGYTPNDSLILVGSTLYGMTPEGGTNNKGVIFSVPVGGGTPTVLYNFDGSGSNSHGANPYGSLTVSTDGTKLYGMTSAG